MSSKGKPVRLPAWPSQGFGPPARPEPGAHAEIQFPGTSSHSHGLLGVPSLHKKTVAYVMIRTPGGGLVTRTLKGNLRIRFAMEWCEAFNQLSGT